MGRDRRGVTKASESSIQITFQFRGQRCREKIALKPTATNLNRAEQHRAAILHAIATGSFDYATTFPNSPNAAKFADRPGQTTSSKEYLTAWLLEQKKHLKASTHDGYSKIVNNVLIPSLGHSILADITRRQIRTMLDGINAGNKRLANIQSVLRAALTAAMHDDLVESNPMYGWTYARNEQPKARDKIDPFSPEEQAAILACCPPGLRNQWQFMLWTGLRTSEMVALDWGDIDFLRGVAVIDKALTTAADEPEDTKTASGRREVKLLGPALDALAAQKSLTFLAGAAVFVHHTSGQRWQGDQQVRKAWIPILKRAGVRYRRPYQTRHTYASMMLSAGEHPMWVAKQMGHADWTMIARIYGRWMPAADAEAGSRAETKFAAPKQPKRKAI